MTRQSQLLLGWSRSFGSSNSSFVKISNSVLGQTSNQISGTVSDSISFPLSIFSSELSPLEAATKYLKEEKDLSYREISIIINRDERTVWHSYNNAIKKQRDRFSLIDSSFSLPLHLITDRSLSLLESITVYMKEFIGLRYCKIASILNKNDRTIWTVYNRAKNKRRIIVS